MISVDYEQVVYNGNGSQTAWPYSFPIYDGDVVRLILLDADGTETDITQDYFVDVPGSTVYYPGYAHGEEPPEADQPPKVQTGQKLIVYRDTEITQDSDLGDSWPFNVIEKGLDKLTMILQEKAFALARCLKISQGQAAEIDDYDTTVPLAADKVICGNANGNGFEAREAMMEVNGAWDGEGRQIHSVADPTDNQDAATKNYVEGYADGNFMKLQPDGTAWDGRNLPISNVANPTLQQQTATKGYVDNLIAGIVAAGNDVVVLDTVATMKATDLQDGMYVSTAGYHEVNDGGRGFYAVRARVPAVEQTDDTIAYTKTVPDAHIANLKKLGGRTVVWNQLYNQTGSQTNKGVTISIDNGYCTFSGQTDSTGNSMYFSGSDFPIPEGHVVLWQRDFDLVGTDKMIDQYNTNANFDICTKPYQIGATGKAWAQMRYNEVGNDYTGVEGLLMCYDLTLMFGAGNEPATLDEFKAMFPASSNEHSAKTLKSMKVAEVASINSDINYPVTLQKYTVPTAIQALTGYGMSCPTAYNYIDFEEKKFVQNVGSRAYTAGDESDDTVFTDGTNTYYELTTPVETDISNYVAELKNILVEDGGKLTFPNTNGSDYLLPVPSEVTYINGDVDDGGSVIVLDNGNVAELMTDVINVKQFGAKGNGVADDSDALNNACIYSTAAKKPIFVPCGLYFCNTTICVSTEIYGIGEESTFRWRTSLPEGLLSFDGYCHNMNFEMENDFSGNLVHTIGKNPISFPTRALVEKLCFIPNNTNYVGTLLLMEIDNTYGAEISNNITMKRYSLYLPYNQVTQRCEYGLVLTTPTWVTGCTINNTIIDIIAKKPLSIFGASNNASVNLTLSHCQIQCRAVTGFKHDYIAKIAHIGDMRIINSHIWDYNPAAVEDFVIYYSCPYLMTILSDSFDKYYLQGVDPFSVEGAVRILGSSGKSYNTAINTCGLMDNFNQVYDVPEDSAKLVPLCIPYNFADDRHTVDFELWTKIDWTHGYGDQYMRIKFNENVFNQTLLFQNACARLNSVIYKVKRYKECVVVWIVGGRRMFYNMISLGLLYDGTGKTVTNFDDTTETLTLLDVTDYNPAPLSKELTMVYGYVIDEDTVI